MSQDSKWNACERQDLGLLAFANIPRPPPQPWQDVFVRLMHVSHNPGACQSMLEETKWNACERQDLHLLAFANIPRPPPQPWQDVFALLRRGVSRFAASASARAQPAVAGAASGLDLEWFTGVMARLHVNAFRRAPLPDLAETVCNIVCIKDTRVKYIEHFSLLSSTYWHALRIFIAWVAAYRVADLGPCCGILRECYELLEV